MNNHEYLTRGRAKAGALVLPGVVTDTCKQFYTVQCESHVVRATLCGQMRVCKIRVVPGDSVFVELCEYALDRGRIVQRD